MNLTRTLEVFGQEVRFHARRPLLWVELLLIGLMLFGISNGNASIQSGDARVGGHKAFINSEFALTQLFIFLTSLIHVFFASVAAGMSMIRDDESRVGEILHSTPLKPSEYVWGKFLGVLLPLVGVLALQVALAMAFNHLMPHGKNADFIGPFRPMDYLRPTLVFALPSLIMFTGLCFAIGGLTKKPVLVFFLPIVVLMVGVFFLWEWSPVWLSWELNRVLQFVDLTGLRWLKEVWLDVDKGVDFYNVNRVGLDGLIVSQRVLCVALGLAGVALMAQRFAATLRGGRLTAAQTARAMAAVRTTPAPAASTPREFPPLATLGMRSGVPGFLAGAAEVMRAELQGFLRHPGLYLFVPLILLQTLLQDYNVGPFDTRLLNTSGMLATGMFNTLTLLVSMMILFYTTESLQRERSTGFGSIAYATPLRTGALLAGKAAANSVLALAIIVACLLGCMVILGVQGKVPLTLTPFALVWGLLLVPTFLLWTSFVCAVQSLTSNRYVTYTIGLATMIGTGWAQSRGHMNWVWNWNLWGVLRWSDIATFQYDRVPLVLNRILWLGVTALLTVLAVRWFERRERDASRVVHALRPGALAHAVWSVAPLLVLPLAAGAVLGLRVHEGYEGDVMKKKFKDYWVKNIETWRNAPTPELAAADVAVDLFPEKRAFDVQGSFDLVNRTGSPLTRFPVTVNPAWKGLRWTLDGESLQTEDRAGLHIVTLRAPLAEGGRVKLGFGYRAEQPSGISRNGGAQMEFNLPESIVLTAIDGPTLVPILGYRENVGVEDDKNKPDPREWPTDWYVGDSKAALPMAASWFDCHLTVSVPAGLQVNATGEKVADRVANGRRTTEWRTDHPVRLFNLIAGRWAEKSRDGCTVYYDARHPYNVDEMLDALVAARRWYGEWFAPLPWKSLRVSEFAGLPTYAQAPPGNISFSENIGFLAKSEPESQTAFWITAHESAHQWWPNLAMIGEGPGSNVMSEGMAHFSTILLCEQERGLQQRMAFCRMIEDRYGRLRRADSERPLTKLDGQLPGESRIQYDKGGWAFWMLHQHMGAEASRAGLREYLETFRNARDGAAIEDYLAIMRKHASDTTAFDALAHQWFFEVVVPEYKIDEATVEKQGADWVVSATVRNLGTSTMTVPVAAATGERFAKDAAKAQAYRDARTTVTLGPREARTISLRCAFGPERVVVDPDITVLMLERQKATLKLKREGGKVAMN